MIGISHVIVFFVGAIVGRYFEVIIGIFQHIRDDLSKVQSQNKVRLNLNKRK